VLCGAGTPLEKAQSFAGFSGSFEDFEAVVGMNLLERGSFSQFRGGVSRDSFVGSAVVQASSFYVDQRDHVGGAFGDDLEELLTVLGLPIDLMNPELIQQLQWYWIPMAAMAVLLPIALLRRALHAPLPHPSRCLDWRGFYKNGLQNLEPLGLRGQNLQTKELSEIFSVSGCTRPP
jgi:hypothetical protein